MNQFEDFLRIGFDQENINGRHITEKQSSHNPRRLDLNPKGIPGLKKENRQK